MIWGCAMIPTFLCSAQIIVSIPIESQHVLWPRTNALGLLSISKNGTPDAQQRSSSCRGRGSRILRGGLYRRSRFDDFKRSRFLGVIRWLIFRVRCPVALDSSRFGARGRLSPQQRAEKPCAVTLFYQLAQQGHTLALIAQHASHRFPQALARSHAQDRIHFQ